MFAYFIGQSSCRRIDSSEVFMAARVFLSSGQRETRREGEQDEKAIAARVRAFLEDRGFTVYVAAEKQSLDDVMHTIAELKQSDYFLFIDFFREGPVPFSLFTHQELAVATDHRLPFLGFRQTSDGVTRPEGFIKYTLAQPTEFINQDDLLAKLAHHLECNHWEISFCRNLTIDDLSLGPIMFYGDHAGAPNPTRILSARIRNGRVVEAARNAVCVLREWVDPSGTRVECPDRSQLKWAGRIQSYSTTILPQDHCRVDLLAVSCNPDRKGVFLHSQSDVNPRTPVLEAPGNYQLHFRVHADDFGFTDFSVALAFRYGEGAVPVVMPLVDEFRLLDD
jgi:hypothetical protein